MDTIVLKNLPEELKEKLTQRAKRSKRSLDKEAIACLEEVLLVKETSSIDFLAEAEKIRRRLKFKIKQSDITKAIKHGRA